MKVMSGEVGGGRGGGLLRSDEDKVSLVRKQQVSLGLHTKPLS